MYGWSRGSPFAALSIPGSQTRYLVMGQMYFLNLRTRRRIQWVGAMSGHFGQQHLSCIVSPDRIAAWEYAVGMRDSMRNRFMFHAGKQAVSAECHDSMQ